MEVGHLITRVRRVLDQVPLQNEDVLLDSHVLGSPSTAFSDEDLTGRLNNAMRVIVSRCKAQHVPQAIEEFSSEAEAEANTVRILPRRVFRQDSNEDWVRCSRRSVDAHRRLDSSGREPTEDYPVFTYEDGRIRIYPEGSDVRIYGVVPPPDMDHENQAAEAPIDERFELAMVMYAVSSCYQTMQQNELDQFARQVFENEIDAFSLGVRYGLLEEKEVDTE